MRRLRTEHGPFTCRALHAEGLHPRTDTYQGWTPCAGRVLDPNGRMKGNYVQDWSTNYDGTRDPLGRAVRGAVQDS